MKLSKIIVLNLLISFASGCSWIRHDTYRDQVRPYLESIKDTYKPLVVDGVREPENFPDLDDNDDTVEGIDQNKDGVRDDIEIFANRNIYSLYEREALKNAYRVSIDMYKKSLDVKKIEDLASLYKSSDYSLESCFAALDEYDYPISSIAYSSLNYRIYLYDSSLRERVFGEITTAVFNHLMKWSTETAAVNERINYCPQKMHPWIRKSI